MSSNNRKRAVLYLRVSSRGQLETDYDDDGLSIAGQRERCAHKAAEFNADVIGEYIERAESAKTDHRPALKEMLTRIKTERDVDYVVLWKVDRFARNRRDDSNMLFDIELAGARLISATENIDQTPAGRLMHGMLASFAEYYSRNLANEVVKGATQKAKRGGTPGPAPIGYLNVREQLPQGREIRTVVIDPERAPVILWAYETYATGVYSLLDMVTLLDARGLRTRGNRRCAPRALDLSAVHRLLSNPYYTGVVTYRGKQYPEGRHDRIVSEKLFEEVQDVLKAHNKSGERDRKHQHFLKGTIRCAHCDRRLIYSRNPGRGGTYEYFICGPAQRCECPNGYQRVDAVEAAIENHYKTITLTPSQQQRAAAEIERRLAQQAITDKREISHQNTLLAGLKEQEKKLLDKHYQDEISDELYREESARIRRGRINAETSLAQMNIRYDDLKEFLALVLHVTAANLHDLYLRAKPYVRRLMNQAIFEVIWVWDEDKVKSKLATPFREITEIGRAVQIEAERREYHRPRPTERIPGSITYDNAEAPDPSPGPENFDVVGCISDNLVGRAGIEPATLGLRGPCSAN